MYTLIFLFLVLEENEQYIIYIHNKKKCLYCQLWVLQFSIAPAATVVKKML